LREYKTMSTNHSKNNSDSKGSRNFKIS